MCMWRTAHCWARRGQQELTRTLCLVIRILFSLISHSCFGLMVSSVGGADLQAQLNFPTCNCALTGSKVGTNNLPRPPGFPSCSRVGRAQPQARHPTRERD